MKENNVESLQQQDETQQQAQYDINFMIDNLARANTQLQLENAELKAIIQTMRKEGNR